MGGEEALSLFHFPLLRARARAIQLATSSRSRLLAHLLSVSQSPVALRKKRIVCGGGRKMKAFNMFKPIFFILLGWARVHRRLQGT